VIRVDASPRRASGCSIPTAGAGTRTISGHGMSALPRSLSSVGTRLGQSRRPRAVEVSTAAARLAKTRAMDTTRAKPARRDDRERGRYSRRTPGRYSRRTPGRKAPANGHVELDWQSKSTAAKPLKHLTSKEGRGEMDLCRVQRKMKRTSRTDCETRAASSCGWTSVPGFVATSNSTPTIRSELP
jgi:hypothetical protein